MACVDDRCDLGGRSRLVQGDDLTALTKEAAEISGITYITDLDRNEVEEILSF